MSNTALAFDTLQYAKKLREAGVPEQQAEVQAEALREIIDDKLATKADIRQLELEIKRSEESTKAEIKRLEENTKAEFKRLEENTKVELKHIEEKIFELEDRLNNRINEMSYKLTIRLGGLIVVGVFVLASLIKL